MNILGLSLSHDATAILFKDGEVAYAASEERHNRIKAYYGFPYLAIQAIQDRCDKVDMIAIAGHDTLLAQPIFFRLLFTNARRRLDPANELPPGFALSVVLSYCRKALLRCLGLSRPVRDNINNTLNRKSNRRRLDRALRMLGVDDVPLRFFDHHECHAANAFYSSGCERALVVTNDGVGDDLCATVSIADHNGIKRIFSERGEASLANLYAAVTKYCGFQRLRHEGKITGLAAYGDPARTYKQFADLFTYDESSCLMKNQIDQLAPISIWERLRLTLRGKYFWGKTNAYLKYFDRVFADVSREDVAAGVQKFVEDCLVRQVSSFVRETGETQLCLSGGIFANVKLNQRLREIPGIENVYIHPNMGDGGNALGAALLAYREKDLDYQGFRQRHVYYGDGYTRAEVEKELQQADLCYTIPPCPAAEVAQLLAAGKIVGLYEGRMEYGPRALGARTILASATDAKINEELNSRLQRSEFMPFAPVVLVDDAADYFSDWQKEHIAAEFMTITYDATEKCKREVPAIVHIDGTARPQVIYREVNPLYYDIISEYKKLTGISIVINTSFNVHEEPIVRHPREAINAFISKRIDALIIEGCLVVRE